MKEIIAIIRPQKLLETRQALLKAGISGYTTIRVLGRSRQRGLMYQSDRSFWKKRTKRPGIPFLPKRLFSTVVEDADAEKVTQCLIQANQTGQYGDGRVFVLDVGEAVRIRTGEQGSDAVRSKVMK